MSYSAMDFDMMTYYYKDINCIGAYIIYIVVIHEFFAVGIRTRRTFRYTHSAIINSRYSSETAQI